MMAVIMHQHHHALIHQSSTFLMNPQFTLNLSLVNNVLNPPTTSLIQGFNPLFTHRLRPISLPATRRKSQSTYIVSASKSSHISQTSSFDDQTKHANQKLVHHFSLRMIMEVITFIWRLPGIVARFIKKEENLLDQIEDDIDEAANAIKLGSKVVEGLAEGIEKVGEAIDNAELEKVAKTMEEDAKKVDVLMDKVKTRTKIVHDEIEEVASSLGESMQGVEKVVEKIHVEEQKVSLEETTKHSALIGSSPLVETPSEHIANTHIEQNSLLQDLKKLWQVNLVFHNVQAISRILQQQFPYYELPLCFSTRWMKALIVVSLVMPLVVSLQPSLQPLLFS